MLKALPQIEPPARGATGWVLDGPNHQVVFIKNDGPVETPEHTNCNQWGVVIEGEFEMIIDGKPTTYKKGDTYFVPAGVRHIGKCDAPAFVIDFFDEGGRHKVTEP